MNYTERLKEAERLERENVALLSTPLMSEGNISPMQVGLFSHRQKERWQKAVSAKMNLETRIKELRYTDKEVTHWEVIEAQVIREARISQLERQIEDIESLGAMSHKPNGELKLAYKRTLDIAQAELKDLLSQNVRSR